MKKHEGTCIGTWRNMYRNMKEHVGTWSNIKEYEGIRKNMNEGIWLGFLWTKNPKSGKDDIKLLFCYKSIS